MPTHRHRTESRRFDLVSGVLAALGFEVTAGALSQAAAGFEIVGAALGALAEGSAALVLLPTSPLLLLAAFATGLGGSSLRRVPVCCIPELPDDAVALLTGFRLKRERGSGTLSVPSSIAISNVSV